MTRDTNGARVRSSTPENSLPAVVAPLQLLEGKDLLTMQEVPYAIITAVIVIQVIMWKNTLFAMVCIL